MRFPRRPFDAVLAMMAALNWFVDAIAHSDCLGDLAIKHIQRSFAI
jgi:hypothetical protein